MIDLRTAAGASFSSSAAPTPASAAEGNRSAPPQVNRIDDGSGLIGGVISGPGSTGFDAGAAVADGSVADGLGAGDGPVGSGFGVALHATTARIVAAARVIW